MLREWFLNISYNFQNAYFASTLCLLIFTHPASSMIKVPQELKGDTCLTICMFTFSMFFGLPFFVITTQSVFLQFMNRHFLSLSLTATSTLTNLSKFRTVAHFSYFFQLILFSGFGRRWLSVSVWLHLRMGLYCVSL